MKPTLVILAAWMWSRYGGWGLKQIDKMWPSWETIMEYAIYDAVKAWFWKIVFVIRESFADAFEKQFWHRSSHIELAYAFQDVNPVIEWVEYPERTKPRGTWHAILAAKDHITTSFVCIYADDYGGPHAMQLAKDFLVNECSDSQCALLWFELKQTLSPNWSVNRGELIVDENNYLERTVERLKVRVVGDHGEYPLEDWSMGRIELDALVNMWCFCFAPSVLDHFENMFVDFVKEHWSKEWAEFFIPLVLDNLMQSGEVKCKVIQTDDKRFWVSYQDDKLFVQQWFAQMTEDGMYPSPLWS